MTDRSLYHITDRIDMERHQRAFMDAFCGCEDCAATSSEQMVTSSEHLTKRRIANLAFNAVYHEQLNEQSSHASDRMSSQHQGWFPTASQCEAEKCQSTRTRLDFQTPESFENEDDFSYKAGCLE